MTDAISSKNGQNECPLCFHHHIEHVEVSTKPLFKYGHCQQCDLIFMAPSDLPMPNQEKARYEFHQNDETAGYRQFLNPVKKFLNSVYSPELRCELTGLDFGSGPHEVSVLQKMLKEEGFYLESYDPFFKPQEELLGYRYDYITCTEVVEHFHKPAQSWSKLAELMRPLSHLIVMTDLSATKTEFDTWSYRRDHTHVAFYSEKTMKWIAARWGFDLVSIEGNLIVFRKSDKYAGPRYVGDLV